MSNYRISYELPEGLKKAILNDKYSRTTKYSTTMLDNEPRYVWLSKRYSKEIREKLEAEPTDALWRFFGTVGHKIMEETEGKNDLIEERLKLAEGDVSGQIDIYEGIVEALRDYKITSVWGYVLNNDNFRSYMVQNEINAFLLKRYGFPVRSMETTLILRDWRKGEYEKGIYEVPSQVVNIIFDEPTGKIDNIDILEWIINRIKIFDFYEKVNDENLPDCSKEFRKAKPGAWKVYWNESKAKSPKSKKNFAEDEEHLAIELAKELTEADPKGKKTYRAEFVEGNNFIRCEKFCDCAEFCSQYQKHLSGE